MSWRVLTARILNVASCEASERLNSVVSSPVPSGLCSTSTSITGNLQRWRKTLLTWTGHLNTAFSTTVGLLNHKGKQENGTQPYGHWVAIPGLQWDSNETPTSWTKLFNSRVHVFSYPKFPNSRTDSLLTHAQREPPTTAYPPSECCHEQGFRRYRR